MSHELRIREIRALRLEIPLRFCFEHATAARSVADPVLVELTGEAPFNEITGYGETLARAYVTGETAESVLDDITEFFVPHLLDFRVGSFGETLEFLDTLPMLIDGRLVTAARTAVELALLDVAGRAFQRRAADAASWLDMRGSRGNVAAARYSGIVVGRSPRKLRWTLRAQRLLGIRDFKIKVATEGWPERIALARRALERDITAGRATLRADANGAWSLPQAEEALPLLRDAGVSALEQPLHPRDDHLLGQLLDAGACDLIADESLLTREDCEDLIETGAVKVFNIRLAKHGGLLPALRIAETALAAGADVQLGCLVGETSILAAAGVAFLEACPRVRFVEGAYSRFLLTADVTRAPVCFGIGGRMKPRPGFGLGVEVDRRRVERLAAGPARRIPL